jgi:hypothetical protein
VIGAALDLTTADELMLLAIEPKTGRIAARPPHSLPLALGGAMLMDLMHDHDIAVVDDKVVAGADTGQPWRDAILARIRSQPIPQGIGYWVVSLGVPQFRAQDRVMWRLIERRLVSLDVRPVLGGVFSSMHYVVAQPEVRGAIRNRVAAAMATDDPVDAQTVSLIAMAAASGILHRFVAKGQRAVAQRRLLAMVQADERATSEAVTAAQFVSAATVEVYSAVCAGGHAGGGGHGGGHGGH